MNLFIEKDSDNIFDENGDVVGEQRGKLCKLAPFANAVFVESGYPEGWKLDAEEWPIMYEGTTLDIARPRQYFECYFGLFIVPFDNDFRLNRCAIHLKNEILEQIDGSLTLSYRD